jgi:hypothetical protein
VSSETQSHSFPVAASLSQSREWSLKSYDLQYNMLVLWADGADDLSTKPLTFKVYFLIISYNLYDIIQKFKENDLQGFCKEFCKIIWKKNNTWNIRNLVNELFVPLAQWTSVLFCRLTDFRSMHSVTKKNCLNSSQG